MQYFPKRYLFLDIDGVIIPNKCYLSNFNKEDIYDVDELAIKFLKRLCYHYSFDIVISSSWKHLHNRLYRLLTETGLMLYLHTPDDMRSSCTPTVQQQSLNEEEKKTACWGRGLEIREYLRSVNFDFVRDECIIIDDDYFDVMYWEQFANFKVIHADTYNGITYKNMEDMLTFAKEGS